MSAKPDAKAESAFSPALLTLIWLAGVAYAAALMTPALGAQVKLGLTFNDMLVHLLRGRFDIDPGVIGGEAFVRDGRSYAYFGPFCAVLRLPLLLTGRIGVDMTGASLLIASALSLACRLIAAATVLGGANGLAANRTLRWAVLAAAVASGESVQYLHPSLYQEVVSWGAALASLFVLLAVRLVLGIGRSRASAYAAMALVAGLALLCRVSFGLGLYCSLGLMLVVEVWRASAVRTKIVVTVRRLAPAVALLILAAGLAAGVNQARWGQPLTFVPLRYQVIAHQLYPDRLPRLARYGEINPRRIPFSLQYYFAPVWALADGHGQFILQKPQLELFEDVELPPSTLLLSDPVTCILAIAGVSALTSRRRWAMDAALARATLLGLAVPACLMLMAISLTFRYRMEFYPALDFAGWLGLAAWADHPDPLPKYAAPALGVVAGAGMVAASIGLMIYAIVPFGPATDLDMAHGWTGVVADRLAGRNVRIGHLMPDGRRLAQDPS